MRLVVKRKGMFEDAMHAFIDVIFLLLIYFMCTASFSLLEKDLEADLPTGSTRERSREEKDLEPVRIFVQLGGGFRCNRRLCDDDDELRRMLAQLQDIADVPVIVDGDADVPFGRVVIAMDAAIAARFSKVAFAARGRGP